MHIVIAGGSGFLGTALADALVQQSHEVTVLIAAARQRAPRRTGVTLRHMDTQRRSRRVGERHRRRRRGRQSRRRIDCGETLVGRAETEPARQPPACDTSSLTAAIRRPSRRPACSISGSAVGYYGDRGDETLTEASAPGSDFLAGAGRRVGGGGQRRGGSHARRAHPDGHRARQARRRAAEDAAAVSDVRRRSPRVRPAIHAVDPQGRLGAARHLGHQAGRRAGRRQRDEPTAGDQRGIFEGARPRAPTGRASCPRRRLRCASRWARWPTRCCSAASAPCRCAQQISVLLPFH